MLHVISARCVARGFAHHWCRPLEYRCWRQLAAPPTHPSVHHHTCLPVHQNTCLSINIPVCPTYPSIHQVPVYPSRTCLSTRYLSIQHTCLPVNQNTCLSINIPVCPTYPSIHEVPVYPPGTHLSINTIVYRL